MTNYERIKNMSKRRLAIQLSDFVDCDTCPFDNLICRSDYAGDCACRFEEWLDEEAEK